MTPAAITFVSSHAKRGGSERVLETLLEHLVRTGTPSVVVLEKGPFLQRLDELGIDHEVIGCSGRVLSICKAALRLRRHLRRRKPELVHANGVKAALVSVVATIGMQIPVVWAKHDFSWDGRIGNLIARRARLVVAVSTALLSSFPHRLASKLRVVHVGLHVPSGDRASARAALQRLAGTTGPVVTLTGRLHSVKGHDDVIDIAGDVSAAIPGVRFAFIGGDDSSTPDVGKRLRDKVARLGLEGVAIFLGHRDDATELQRGADVGLIPSVVDDRGMGREGFPLSGLELMAVGTPIVGYAHGGLPEMVGTCARLVLPGDRNGLKRELIQLLKDDSRRRELSRCGTERATSEFTVDRMIQGMTAAYSEALRS